MKGQLPFEYGHTPSHAEDDLIVGEGNRLALDHIRAFPAWPGPLTLIVGPGASGKSHLARIFADRSGAAFVGPDQAQAAATEGGTLPLIVEDADRAGFEEAALFHLLNQSMRAGRPLLLTARSEVADWPFRTADLLSRARLAARFAITVSHDIQLSQMFVKLFGDRQISVEPRVLSYLVQRMERSAEEAVALVETMDRLALARKSPITRAIAAEALAERGAAQDWDEADDHD
ncbi:hypothetical protein EMQ25_06645 [Arsenicitalea aurantiaca]|uniref:Chromosomal replication initiator protein DnaA domain-containing protein n=1 Tax=Arsenicitalea aurantiaca TaxID=1783274 RepID=A0A433XFF3_9HYPH|nr:hypothetical protein [Arsenicitalea aurantiaca]RUT32815.1 hypothetical protein EMQ25_06645 [Arsenicitalea aurantiaca]